MHFSIAQVCIKFTLNATEKFQKLLSSVCFFVLFFWRLLHGLCGKHLSEIKKQKLIVWEHIVGVLCYNVRHLLKEKVTSLNENDRKAAI